MFSRLGGSAEVEPTKWGLVVLCQLGSTFKQCWKKWRVARRVPNGEAVAFARTVINCLGPAS